MRKELDVDVVNFVKPDAASAVPDIHSTFDIIAVALKKNHLLLEVSFHPTLGYPTWIRTQRFADSLLANWQFVVNSVLVVFCAPFYPKK